MPAFSTTRRVPFTSRQMFDLVADVEQYPKFLPLCEALTVKKRERDGNKAVLICEMTVGVPSVYGIGCTWVARAESPKNNVPRTNPMMTSVTLAFFHSGRRNAVTPFEIASTPVTAAPPDANACSTTARVAP